MSNKIEVKIGQTWETINEPFVKVKIFDIRIVSVRDNKFHVFYDIEETRNGFTKRDLQIAVHEWFDEDWRLV